MLKVFLAFTFTAWAWEDIWLAGWHGTIGSTLLALVAIGFGLWSLLDGVTIVD